MPTNVELLEVEIDTLWRADERGRLVAQRRRGWHPAPHLTLGVTEDGWTIAFGDQVSDPLLEQLETAIAAEPPTGEPVLPPALLGRCEMLLREALGDVSVYSGPSFSIPEGTSFESSADILRSSDSEALREQQDLARLGWEPDEWQDLLNGKLGPWAMAVVDGRVVSICHTARLSERGAEAGVWTDADFRGRGHAAAVTAAWAALLSPSGRQLFYSTSADNTSSQRVAARLGLPPIGWLWTIRAATS